MRLTSLAVLVASVVAVHAQPGPPRDRQLEATGSGIVRGVVTDADTGQPLRRAEVRVTVMSPAASRATTRTTIADTEGRFEFTDLPPGVVTLRASKNSYYNEDEASAGGSSAPPRSERLTLAAGQTLDRQTVRLRRGGAIVGHLVDEFGEPVEGAAIEVLRRVPTGDGPRWTAVGRGGFGRAQTDDTGAFRVWSLPPGQYVVAARPNQMQAFRDSDGGRVREGFAPTYFPGVTRLGEARLVTIPAGTDSAPVVFALATAPLATVRGTVVGATGQRLDNVTLMVSRIDRDRLDGGGSSADVADDGTFQVSRLPPGRYQLSATEREPSPNGRWQPGSTRSYAVAELDIDGVDLEGVTLALRPGSTLTGRLTIEGGGAPPPSAAIQVTLIPADRNLMRPGQPSSQAAAADGSFRFDSVFGKQFVRVFGTARPSPNASSDTAGSAPPETWFMTSVTLDGREVIDVPLEFDGRPVDVSVTMTTRPAVVSGTVTWTALADAKPPTVVVFIDDPTRWHREARSIRSVAAGADGRFRIRGLPAADRYLAAAVEGLEPADARQPALLDALRNAATPLRIDEGGAHELTLRAVPNPQP